MIQEIENRRSIRKYRIDKVDRKIIEEILYSATITPSAKTGSPGSSSYIRGTKKTNWSTGRLLLQGLLQLDTRTRLRIRDRGNAWRMLWNIEMEDKIFHINKIIY